MIDFAERLNRSIHQHLVGLQRLPCGTKPGTEKSGMGALMMLRMMLAVFNGLGGEDTAYYQ